ncbi:unnamed protein product [Hydatigera taeniaeformis]|uniref:Centrosomal protein kizuna n=1 Tax=Hydatigena taeniaeformis TaxID=6205 RepID=A0A0R3X833_HYDTA|nr:unnamed protein product [Hydatigera taeniaeformis]
MIEHSSFLYRPNPCEVSRIKANEILKRRQIRMTQVRRLSKVYSAIARNIYRETKRAQTGYENLLLQKQQIAEDFALLQTRQRMLDGIMEHFGHGHRNANSWASDKLYCFTCKSKDPVVEERKRLSITRVTAKKRFAEAYADLLVTRARSLRNVEMRRHLRETVRVAERARAATIAALPPPSRDPLDAHLNPSGVPCSRCLSDTHKACHLFMDTNEPPLKSGNQELKETGEVKGGGVLSGPLRLEKNQFELNVHCIASSRVDDPVNPDALVIAVAKNECADFACQRAIPLDSESGLSSRIHVQFATGRTHSKQEDELLMQKQKHISLSEAEVGHGTHIEDLSSSLGRPTLVTPDPKPLDYVQFHPYCTTLMDPHLVLRGQDPGEQTNLPSSALSPCQDFIAQPHPSTGPTSCDLRTLTFHKKPPVLPFAIPTNLLKFHTSESIELPSTGTDALDASKILVIRPHGTKISVSESCGISEMDNGRPSSTVLSEMVSFDCIKMQLEYESSVLNNYLNSNLMERLFVYSSEVENIDKAITELRKSFSSSILSSQSTQDNEVNSIRICALSTSPNLATNHSGSPSKVVEVLERSEAMVKGAREDGTLHNAESCHSDFINNGIAMNAPSLSAALSAEKGDERQSPGAASPTTSLSSSPISGSTAGACTSASAKPSTGARSLPVVESLQRRARELILRQMECIRAGDAGNHIPACGTLELPSHRLMGLAQENGANLEIPSVPAKTLVLNSLGSSHDLDDDASPILDTLPLTSCQSWAQPMISPASVLLSSLRRPSPPSSPLPSLPSSYTMPSSIATSKAKYSLQSIPTQLEDKVNSQVAFNASVQTDSTPNSSSRPSNQFSYLSSQSSCLPAEAPLVSESEASQKHASCVPINQSTTPAGSASTTLRALRRGLSNGFKSGFKESHLRPFCDASVGTLNLEKGERLTSLRSEFVADEVFPSLCSDPSLIPTTNNTSSFLQQSSAFMNDAKEPSTSPLLNSQSLQVKAPFKVGMIQHPPSKSLSLDVDTSSTKRESERVLCSVDTSPISTLMRLQSESIPPTPVSDINKNLTLLTRSKLINPSKSLPIVAQFDDMEEIGTDSTMSAHALKNPTLYSLLACCNIAGNCVAPSCNANVLSESTRKKCETESRNQSTETSCSACDSIDIGTSPSVSLHSFLENEACVQSPVEQKRDGGEAFYKEEALTVHTDFLTVPSSSRGLVQQTRRSSYSPLALGRPLISIKLESLSTSSTLKDLARSDQKEGNEATTTSTLATLPVGNVEGGKSVSDAASPTILVCSKSVNAKASNLMSDNMKIDMMNPVAVEADAGGSNSAKALVPDLVDGKVDDKAANTEEFAFKPVSVNAGSEDSIESKGSEIAPIFWKPADARQVGEKLTCAEPEDVGTSDEVTDTVASIRVEAVDVIETGAESVGTAKSEAVLTDVEIVGSKSPVSKAFTVASLDVITSPTIELVGAKKGSVKAATREFLVSAPSAGATAGFVDLLSVETSSVELKSSGSTNVKMAGIKTFDKEVLGAAAVRAMNVAENVPIDFITTKLEGEFGINSTDLEIPGIQSFSAKMSASEETDQSEIVPEPTAFEMNITKSNPLESHAAVSRGLRVSNPSLLAANSGSTRLTGMEVTDVERNHDHAILHQPKRAAIYAAATPTDLPVYLIANTAATTARMRKVRDELEVCAVGSIASSRP